MASKKKPEKEAASKLGGVEQHSRQIWLAGLGAYAKAGDDAGKLFDNLVKEGEKAEKLAKLEAAKPVAPVKATAATKATGLKEKALSKWGELEEAFDQRLDSAMSRLGVPSRGEVAALHEKVDVLMRELARLTGAPAPAQQAAAAPENVTPKASIRKSAAAPAATTASPAGVSKVSTSKAGTGKASVAKPGISKATAKPTNSKPVAEPISEPAGEPVSKKKPKVAKAPVKAAGAKASRANSIAPDPAP